MMDFRVDGPPELVAHIRTIARRYTEALEGSPGPVPRREQPRPWIRSRTAEEPSSDRLSRPSRVIRA